MDEENDILVEMIDSEIDDQAELTLELVHRGIICPPKASLWGRAKSAIAAPWRLLTAAAGWVTWRLWGRVRYERAVRKGFKRWRSLAGVDRPQVRYQYHWRDDGYDLARALAIHDEIIRNRIVPPPRPEADDTGLEALQRGWPVSSGESVVPPVRCADGHSGSPCVRCKEVLFAFDGSPILFSGK